ncbi:hypothetical protein HYPGJ_20779 [Hyphomicrobium sp. GJ21]|nr:hypothetical protein HYPGJ_20779 [Hyphomicrobium sp. GJ21]
MSSRLAMPPSLWQLARGSGTCGRKLSPGGALGSIQNLGTELSKTGPPMAGRFFVALLAHGQTILPV